MTVVNNQFQVELYSRIDRCITSITRAEKVTKERLASVSRDLLEYITLNGSPDVATLNRLLAVLTPMNKKTAYLFFQEFIPHVFEDNKFGKKVKKEDRLNEFINKAKDFLAVKENTIWTWAEKNVKLEKEPVDYRKKLSSLVKKALEDDKDGINPVDVLRAVLEGGVKVDDILSLVEFWEKNKAA